MPTKVLDSSEPVVQVCFVTDDLDKSAKFFADLLGVDVPGYLKPADPDLAKAVYRGQENADVMARIAIFHLGNMDIELLEPDGRPSAWQELLDKNGPCVHHIAFRVPDPDAVIERFEANGMPLVQRGDTDGNNGMYAYLDTVPQLGAFIELLHRY